MDQLYIKYTNIFYCKMFQNLPKFLFENILSGYPATTHA
jgi:hypothetical protein